MAKDYVGNTSVSTTYHASTDAPLAGPARWQTGTQIKGSPFVDATSWPTPPIDQWSNDSGVKGYFLGFVTAALASKSIGHTSKNTTEVKACWGGSLNIYDGNNGESYNGDVTVSDYYKSYINNIRAKGGDVILSFGGVSNEPIEGPITDIKKIVDIYLKTINNYKLTAIDFDFESGFLAHNEALNRHISAITEVIKAKPELKISYTLPVDGTTGLMGTAKYSLKNCMMPVLPHHLLMVCQWNLVKVQVQIFLSVLDFLLKVQIIQILMEVRE